MGLYVNQCQTSLNYLIVRGIWQLNMLPLKVLTINKMSSTSKKIDILVFGRNLSPGLLYGDLVYKLRRVKCEANFFSSGSKIDKRLPRREPCADLSLSIALWLTRQWGLYDGTCPNLLIGDNARSSSPLIVSRDSFSTWTWTHFQTVGLSLSWVIVLRRTSD